MSGPPVGLYLHMLVFPSSALLPGLCLVSLGSVPYPWAVSLIPRLCPLSLGCVPPPSFHLCMFQLLNLSVFGAMDPPWVLQKSVFKYNCQIAKKGLLVPFVHESSVEVFCGGNTHRLCPGVVWYLFGSIPGLYLSTFVPEAVSLGNNKNQTADGQEIMSYSCLPATVPSPALFH